MAGVQTIKRPVKFIRDVDISETGMQGVGLSGLTATHKAGGVQKARLQLSAFPVAIADNGTAGGAGGEDIFQFPDGNIQFLGAVADLAVVGAAGIAATAVVQAALGTVVAAADASLSSTEQDICPVAATTLASSAGDVNLKSTSTEAPKIHDATASAKKVYLNFSLADAGISTLSTISVTGDVWISYMDLGDL